MADTVSKLIKFISEDPIMLGLCFAIVALIIIFILVLIFGGKKNKKSEEIVDKVEDNTQSLLKTTLNDEPLRSTQEFAFNASMNEDVKLENTQSLENIQVLSETPEEDNNAPISVDEAMELKSQREMEASKNTVEIPVLNENVPMVDVPPIKEPVTPPIPPIDLPIPPMEEKHEPANQPLSPVYTTEENKPEMETPVVPHVNNEITTSPAPLVNDGDIDLPKLKTEPTSSIFDTLSGESFNIKNN